jgi:hypothetical protein
MYLLLDRKWTLIPSFNTLNRNYSKVESTMKSKFYQFCYEGTKTPSFTKAGKSGNYTQCFLCDLVPACQVGRSLWHFLTFRSGPKVINAPTTYKPLRLTQRL